MKRITFCLIACLAWWRTGHASPPTEGPSNFHGPAAPTVDPRLGPPFRVADRPRLGPEEAPLVVVEVTSFQCSHCRQFHREVFGSIRAHYIDTGRVQWVLVHAPNADGTRPPVFPVAMGAWRAGKYWEWMDLFFAHGEASEETLVKALVVAGGVSASELQHWATDPACVEAVEADAAEFRHLGVEATPYFLLRKRMPNGRYTQVRLKGYQSEERLSYAIEQMLRK